MSESTAVAVRKPTAVDLVRALLEERADRIAELLPESMDARRFIAVSVLALSKNPGLVECDRASIVLSILEAAEIGLEPTGGVGGAHLVPFKDKSGKKHAQLIYDYRGVQHLIRLGGGGEVKTVLVYEGDDFAVYEGTTDARIEHVRKFATDDPTKITYVYAVPLDNPSKFEVMTKAQIDSVRARSRAANAGPWVTDYGAMARKTVLKRLSAWLPLKPEARAALDRDTEREIAGDAPSEAVVSRTAAVKERVRSRRKPASPRETTQDASEGQEPAPESTPDESAAQQTDTETVVEFCDARLVPVEGPVETCILPAPHDGESHQAESGKRWNA